MLKRDNGGKYLHRYCTEEDEDRVPPGDDSDECWHVRIRITTDTLTAIGTFASRH